MFSSRPTILSILLRFQIEKAITSNKNPYCHVGFMSGNYFNYKNAFTHCFHSVWGKQNNNVVFDSRKSNLISNPLVLVITTYNQSWMTDFARMLFCVVFPQELYYIKKTMLHVWVFYSFIAETLFVSQYYLCSNCLVKL